MSLWKEFQVNRISWNRKRELPAYVVTESSTFGSNLMKSDKREHALFQSEDISVLFRKRSSMRQDLCNFLPSFSAASSSPVSAFIVSMFSSIVGEGVHRRIR